MTGTSRRTPLEFRLSHLLNHFGATARLSRLSTGDVEKYKSARLDAKAAPATVNKELAALRRMATLAHEQYELVVPFRVGKFPERNARKGFFERDALDAVCTHLRPELEALARAAYSTGWRKSELRSRQWTHVDFDGGWLRLDPGETKNGEGRQFPLIPDLRALLEAQRARVEAAQKKHGRVVPWIFAGADGAPVGDFRKAWASACVKAGFFRVETIGEPKDGATPKTRKVATKLVHDFRRTAVRNLERSGVSRSAAMKLTGHKTESVYRRYAIVAESDLREAGAKLAAAAAQQGGKVEAGSGNVRALRAEVSRG